MQMHDKYNHSAYYITIVVFKFVPGFIRRDWKFFNYIYIGIVARYLFEYKITKSENDTIVSYWFIEANIKNGKIVYKMYVWKAEY